jgi:GT2 family glycosyltransferase
MNAGAAATTAEALLFLHADTRLPADALEHVRRILADEDVAGGAFHLAIEGQEADWFFAFTARNANIRSKLAGASYGDQAFFVKRSAFDAISGYRDLPVCEDLDFIRRLRRQGRVVLAPAAASTSARRWEKHGKIRVTVRNGLLFLRYWFG